MFHVQTPKMNVDLWHGDWRPSLHLVKRNTKLMEALDSSEVSECHWVFIHYTFILWAQVVICTMGMMCHFVILWCMCLITYLIHGFLFLTLCIIHGWMKAMSQTLWILTNHMLEYESRVWGKSYEFCNNGRG